jgi:hypothetical protein
MARKISFIPPLVTGCAIRSPTHSLAGGRGVLGRGRHRVAVIAGVRLAAVATVSEDHVRLPSWSARDSASHALRSGYSSLLQPVLDPFRPLDLSKGGRPERGLSSSGCDRLQRQEVQPDENLSRTPAGACTSCGRAEWASPAGVRSLGCRTLESEDPYPGSGGSRFSDGDWDRRSGGLGGGSTAYPENEGDDAHTGQDNSGDVQALPHYGAS